MFALYDKVVIKSKNLAGTIVDIRNINAETIYTVESDVEGKREDGYGGLFPLFECKEEEITRGA